MITWADAKLGPLADISGFSTTSTDFLRLVNRAVKRLLNAGDWWGTVVPVTVYIRRGTITWPRYVGQVRAMNVCHHPINIRNHWYEFMAPGSLGEGNRLTEASRVTACCYEDIPSENCYIRAYPQYPDKDNGKTIKIFGVDNSNRPLQELSGGAYVNGMTLTFNGTDYVQSTAGVYPRRIDRVIKQATQGQVTLYAYDTVLATLTDLAVYEASETEPSYVRYHLRRPWHHGCSGSGCHCLTSTTYMPCSALVKLAYVPIVTDTDMVVIDDDALAEMVQSMKATQANDKELATQLEASAIRILNQQLENQTPFQDTPVDFHETGKTCVGRQRMF